MTVTGCSYDRIKVMKDYTNDLSQWQKSVISQLWETTVTIIKNWHDTVILADHYNDITIMTGMNNDRS